MKTAIKFGVIPRDIIRREGHHLILSPEIRELVRTDPNKALVEAFLSGQCAGREDANQLWIAEANRPGGALKWVPPKRKRARKK